MLFFAILSCAKNPEEELNYVLEKYEQRINSIDKIEYIASAIDTFVGDQSVWNNTGYALIEKDSNDKIFGFSFYGKRDDIDHGNLYERETGYEFSESAKTYTQEYAAEGFLGHTGGQMINSRLFYIDTIYSSLELKSTEEKYILIYKYEPDTVLGITNSVRTIELDKKTFLVSNIAGSGMYLGQKFASIISMKNIKINDEVLNSVAIMKSKLKDYTLIHPDNSEKPCEILNKKFPVGSFPNLLDSNEIIDLKIERLTLFEFWDAACGGCIYSLLDVEKLSKKYSYKLQVIGLVPTGEIISKKLVEKKGITFLNLKVSKEYEKQCDIKGHPSFYLVDHKGIVRNYYLGFDQNSIEKDIETMLDE